MGIVRPSRVGRECRRRRIVGRGLAAKLFGIVHDAVIVGVVGGPQHVAGTLAVGPVPDREGADFGLRGVVYLYAVDVGRPRGAGAGLFYDLENTVSLWPLYPRVAFFALVALKALSPLYALRPLRPGVALIPFFALISPWNREGEVNGAL
ncbi:hypothetical protein SDC9_97654 [bioreactor metagenome]|uniref:Uncharacterized protein n=1 Tax=bioreactor metagenome TaxID=1076179 RepID=A0A645ADY6_9ZZZZ